MVEDYDACGDCGKWKDDCVCEDANASCDNCGSGYRVDGDTWCQDCIDDDTCGDCDERYGDCCCDDEYGDDYCGNCDSNECSCYDDDDDCIRCGLDPETCGCWDKSDDDTDEFDQENIADTFRPMNAFARARWLKAQGKL